MRLKPQCIRNWERASKLGSMPIPGSSDKVTRPSEGWFSDGVSKDLRGLKFESISNIPADEDAAKRWADAIRPMRPPR